MSINVINFSMGFFFAVYTVVKLPDANCMNEICILFQNSKSVSIEYYTLVFKIAFLSLRE